MDATEFLKQRYPNIAHLDRIEGYIFTIADVQAALDADCGHEDDSVVAVTPNRESYHPQEERIAALEAELKQAGEIAARIREACAFPENDFQRATRDAAKEILALSHMRRLMEGA